MIGVHRWLHKRNPEGGEPYLECERCQKQKDTMSLTDNLGPGGAAGSEACSISIRLIEHKQLRPVVCDGAAAAPCCGAARTAKTTPFHHANICSTLGGW